MNYVLKGKIVNPSGFSLDKSLTEENTAAESKAVGTALAQVNDALKTHTDAKDNPHNVTKSQLGLWNVDNTSDLNKPVSKLQAQAIAEAKKAGTDAQTAAANAETNAKSYAKFVAEAARDEALNTAIPYATAVGDNAKSYAKSYADGKHFGYTVTLTASKWYSYGSIYQYDVPISGLLNTDTIFVDLYVADNNIVVGTIEELEEEYSKIYGLYAGNGTITCRATEKPTVNLPIMLRVVR